MPSACEECGAAFNRWRIGMGCRWCRECKLRFCQVCHVRLPEGRRTRRCTACVQALRQQRIQSPMHRCSGCGVRLPTGVNRDYCADCTHATYLVKCQQSIERGPRPCKQCGQSMPAGRRAASCKDCHYKAARAKPTRECPSCKTRQTQRGTALCRPCKTMYNRWRKAYDRGDPIARRLKTKKRLVKRQVGS